MKNTNRRLTSIIMAVIILTVLIAIYVSGALMSESALRADSLRNFVAFLCASPGTDYLGRDMFVRTIRVCPSALPSAP